MTFVEMKMTYEWFTPTGRRRQFYDFAFGMNVDDNKKLAKDAAINNMKKNIKRRIRHENYKVLKTEFS